MCLDFKRYKAIVTLLPFALILFNADSTAQNVTSPYSILGIGDIETKDFGRYFGMGSTSIAMRSGTTYNFTNPASLTALDPKVMNFDLMMRGRSSKFAQPGVDTLTSTSKDFAIRRISIAYKPEKKWAFAVGLRPYSTVNYLLNASDKLGDYTTEISKSVEGTGGFYQFYLSNGYALTKNFSAGLTMSYIFGAIQTQTSYTAQAIGLNITRDENTSMQTPLFTGGLQYSGKISKHVSQQIGVTVTAPAKLNGNLTTTYTTSDSIVSTGDNPSRHLNLPLQLGVGYALVLKNLTVSADYNIYNWKKQKVDYPNSYTDKASRFSAGVEYSFKQRTGMQMKEKYYLQAGFSYEINYLHIQNKSLNDYSYSFGFGNNVSRMLSYNLGLEFGTKGSTKYNQIKENYTQFVIGISLKDFWFNAAKYGKYQ